MHTTNALTVVFVRRTLLQRVLFVREQAAIDIGVEQLALVQKDTTSTGHVVVRHLDGLYHAIDDGLGIVLVVTERRRVIERMRGKASGARMRMGSVQQKELSGHKSTSKQDMNFRKKKQLQLGFSKSGAYRLLPM